MRVDKVPNARDWKRHPAGRRWPELGRVRSQAIGLSAALLTLSACTESTDQATGLTDIWLVEGVEPASAADPSVNALQITEGDDGAISVSTMSCNDWECAALDEAFIVGSLRGNRIRTASGRIWVLTSHGSGEDGGLALADPSVPLIWLLRRDGLQGEGVTDVAGALGLTDDAGDDAESDSDAAEAGTDDDT